MKKPEKNSNRKPPRAEAVNGHEAVNARGGRGARADRTEGQRLLCAVNAAAAEVSRAVGCPKSLVSYWRTGEKVPGPGYRDKLRELYGIDPGAWSARPSGAPPLPPRASTDPAPLPPADSDTMASVIATLGRIETELQNGQLMPSDRVRLYDSHIKALSLKSRREKDERDAARKALDDAEVLEDRVVRESPAWRALRAVIVKAVTPYPDAHRAVIDAITGLERR